MAIVNYAQLWDSKAGSQAEALAAVDGSSDEAIVQSNGRFTAAQVMAALDIQATDHVLELGCGVARIGRELAADCGRWTGVDISARMIERAAERTTHLSNVELHQLTASRLDMIPDASIDKLYSIAVLCHMDKEDLFLYLEETRRVLKPGRLALLETWNLAHPTGWKRWDYEVRHWAASDQSQRKDVSRNQFCTPDEFELYQRQAGFATIHSFVDSPWIQSIVGKDLDSEQLAEHRQRLRQSASEIAYSPLFGQMFEQTIAVIYGVIHPREAVAFIQDHANSREARLFLPFVSGLWAQNTAQWGEPD